MREKQLIHKLYELGAIQFGSFTLKSGIESPIYLDLRVALSSPKLLVAIAEAMHEKIRGVKGDLLCGVPYTALVLATAISTQHNLPMVMRRKEAKDYGTKKTIEGIFQPGQSCIVVEDVITSGKSIMETIQPLQEVGLFVKDIVVLIDREQGGKKFLESQGFNVHSVCAISDILQELLREKKISASAVKEIHQFIQNHQTYA